MSRKWVTGIVNSSHDSRRIEEVIKVREQCGRALNHHRKASNFSFCAHFAISLSRMQLREKNERQPNLVGWKRIWADHLVELKTTEESSAKITWESWVLLIALKDSAMPLVKCQRRSLIRRMDASSPGHIDFWLWLSPKLSPATHDVGNFI